MAIRLNGWQRIGVVLSALWMLFVLFVGVNNYLNGGGAFVHYTPSETVIVKRGKPGRCTEVLTQSSEKGLTIDQIFHEKTDGRGQECLPSHYIAGIPDVTRQTPAHHEFLIGYFLYLLLGPLSISWLSVYALFFSVRWIALGFKQKKG